MSAAWLDSTRETRGTRKRDALRFITAAEVTTTTMSGSSRRSGGEAVVYRRITLATEKTYRRLNRAELHNNTLFPSSSLRFYGKNCISDLSSPCRAAIINDEFSSRHRNRPTSFARSTRIDGNSSRSFDTLDVIRAAAAAAELSTTPSVISVGERREIKGGSAALLL